MTGAISGDGRELQGWKLRQGCRQWLTTMKSGRQREPRIVDIYAHKRPRVGLRVAAHYLGISERVLVARVDKGLIDAVHDGRVWQFLVDELLRYERSRQQRAS